MINEQLQERIQRLKEKRNAVILAHNYQIGEVQAIADYAGDSLELSYKAAEMQADVVVFCGVRFMAETASILCPDKIILMPDINAGCPLADMVTVEGLKALKRKHPQAKVVGYVNTTAEVKAEVDICCTSGNAVNVIKSLEDVEEIIFIPDRNLGSFVQRETGKNIILWDGFCSVHVKILPGNVESKKKLYPDSKVIVHPECTPGVINLSDKVLSTAGMCKYAKENKDIQHVIVGTEIGLLHRLCKESPGKNFYPASELAICPDMKLTTLEKIFWALENMKYEVKVPADIRVKAKQAVDKMVEILP